MRRPTRSAALTALFVAACTTSVTVPEASATVSKGDPAPNFTKSILGGGTFTLEDELGPVIVLFLFGYACPICIDDCPDFEANVHQYYLDNEPGRVKVVGADLWDGSTSQVLSFRNQTGATFPLLLDGSQAAGGNLTSLYGPYDNYIVIDGGGIVRYHAADIYSHGNRYHLDEIRDAVDGALSAVVVGDAPSPVVPGLALRAAPSPFTAFTSITLENVTGRAVAADVSVFDASGRRVVSLFRGAAPVGPTTFRWDGRTPGGYRASPGVYYVRARAGALVAHERVVVVR